MKDHTLPSTLGSVYNHLTRCINFWSGHIYSANQALKGWTSTRMNLHPWKCGAGKIWQKSTPRNWLNISIGLIRGMSAIGFENDQGKDAERLCILITLAVWAIWKSRNKSLINDQDVWFKTSLHINLNSSIGTSQNVFIILEI